MMEARNLRNMTMVQTPLLGDENTPVHLGPGGGTGFESATPRHQVAFTPNPLATPRGDVSDVSATPRTDAGIPGTPLRTPMRDSLSINPEGFSIGSTPRDQRLRANSVKRALQAGFSSLPKPENNFELLVPEDDEDGAENVDGANLSEEDAAERDARIRRVREEEERKALARRSQVVQLSLPRPANVDVDLLLQRLTVSEAEEEKDIFQAQQLVNAELVQLMQHDAITYPIPGTSLAGATHSSYEMPADEDVVRAKEAIHSELASLVGFPNANPDQLREGLLTLSKAETVDESASWAAIREQLVYDVSSKTWVSPSTLSLEDRVAGYNAILSRSRERMTKDANKASKAEKKLGITLGGYQARAQILAKRIIEASEQLQYTKVEYVSFSHLRTNEEVVGPRRVSSLREEVDKLERRERLLQERYAELAAERRESESRVALLEEKMMAEAEALNEAQLASMDE